jgi:hypothetical protein
MSRDPQDTRDFLPHAGALSGVGNGSTVFRLPGRSGSAVCDHNIGVALPVFGRMVYSIVCGRKKGTCSNRCKRTGISQMLSYASGIIAQILSMQNPPHKGVIVIEELFGSSDRFRAEPASPVPQW